jgi:Putative beta-barrel porin-2, OmpL-like. bbp2
MKKILKAVSAVALLGTLAMPAFADDATTTTTPTTVANTDTASTNATDTDAKDQKDLKKVIEDQGINYVETAQKGITLSGYVDTSYTYQFAGSGEYGQAGVNPGGGPGNSQAALRQFDVSNNTFNVNAVKIALEKALPDKNEWAAGFRIDTIYGSDAQFLGDTAFNGNAATSTGTVNNSGLAIEQALVKFRIPIGNGLDIYAGKFVTFLGYEVIESPANLNFSRGLLFTNLIPLTNTGVYADYKFNSTVEAKLAVVDGWNNSTSPSSVTDRSDFGKAIMGQVNVNAPGGNANITQSFIYSPQGEPGINSGTAGGFNTGTQFEGVYDIWGNWNPTFVKNGNLLLGFNGDIGQEAQSGFYGIALYAQYKFTKVFSLAGRAEYIHDDSSATPKFGVVNPTTGVAGAQDDYAYTLTASFNMWDNLLTRIEYRIDDVSGNTTGTGHTQIENEISLNAVYSF